MQFVNSSMMLIKRGFRLKDFDRIVSGSVSINLLITKPSDRLVSSIWIHTMHPLERGGLNKLCSYSAMVYAGAYKVKWNSIYNSEWMDIHKDESDSERHSRKFSSLYFEGDIIVLRFSWPFSLWLRTNFTEQNRDSEPSRPLDSKEILWNAKL